MIQSLKSYVTGQKGMEKTMVMMILLLLVGLCHSAGLSCKTDAECRRNVCINQSCGPKSLAGGPCEVNSHCLKPEETCLSKLCKPKSPSGGACDVNDNADCAVPQSTCNANNLCVPPASSGQCSQNSQCASPSDSCIGLTCKVKADVGGTCDANDNADCAIASSTCGANAICLSPTDGKCTQNSQCASSSDSCIGQKCKAKADVGGTCDANDNADCAIASSTCGANAICLSPTDGKCTQNSQCASSSDSCIGLTCKVKADVGGTCDANDNADCAIASSTCGANAICLSPTDGKCTQNSQCASSSDSCIGQKCKAKADVGGTCDSNDNADCLTDKCSGTSCAFSFSNFKWEGNKAMSTQRNGPASVAAGGFLFVFGGLLASGSLTNTVEMYNPQNNSWVTKADMPVSTWRHTVVVVGNFIYLIGGADATSVGQNNFFRYDIQENKWTTLGQLPAFPAALHSVAAAVKDSIIFTFGGQTGFAQGTAVNKIYSFDTASSGQWTTNLPTFTNPLTQAAAVLVSPIIYISGGLYTGAQTKTYTFDTRTPSSAPQDSGKNLVLARSNHASFYNPTTNKIHVVGGIIVSGNRAKTMETLDLNAQTPAWSEESTGALNMINTASSGGLIGSRFYYPGMLYVSNSNDLFAPSSVLNVLDVSGTPKWVPFAASTNPAFYATVGKVGSNIISAVGSSQSGGNSVQTSSYSITSNTWSSASATITGRREVGSAVVGSELYSIGGFKTTTTTETYALSSDQTTWTNKGNLIYLRQGLCAASEGNKIFAYGGFVSSGVAQDSMEIYDASVGTWRDVTASSKTAGFTPTAVAFCAAISTGTKILIFGGRTANLSPTNLIQSFNIATEKWEAPITSSPAITSRFGLSATILRGHVILTGGTLDNLNAPMATVEAFDISTGIVSTLPDLPTPRYGHGSVTDGDSVFVVGGANGNSGLRLIAPIEKFRAFP